MDSIMEIIKTDTFLLAIVAVICVLLISVIVLIAKFSSLNKKYKNFIVKIGNGSNFEEDLETYMNRVNEVEEENKINSESIEILKNNLTRCIQKIGMVRYNAFKDVGSDLSFTLALLDENDNGVVLNGIYSRETSNIYAKPIKSGKATYTLSDEETEAIQKAIASERI